MWSVEFYETPTGKCPAAEFLKSLNERTELPYIQYDLDRLEELGNKLGPPYVKPLGDHIYELRTKIGTVNYRLLFFFDHEKIVISNGFRKEGKVPPNQIARAKQHRKDYLQRHARKK